MKDDRIIVHKKDLKKLHEDMMEAMDKIKELYAYYYAWNELYSDVRKEANLGYADSIILEIKMRELIEELRGAF